MAMCSLNGAIQYGLDAGFGCQLELISFQVSNRISAMNKVPLLDISFVLTVFL